MTTREKALVVVASLALVAAVVPWALPAGTRIAFPPEASAAERGRLVAEHTGCFACHGEGGRGGTPNPGSHAGSVPGFTGGTPMMFAENADELRTWIRQGRRHPEEKREERKPAGEGPLLRMPAFEQRLSAEEIDDLVAWILAVSPLEKPQDEHVAHGLSVAQANGCFSCHGPMGSGGVKDSASLKGYIPGWFGNDLGELAKNDDEIEEWIRTGTIQRLAKNPGAKHFLDAEVVKMPAFGERLKDDEIRDAVALVRWIHAQGGGGAAKSPQS